MVASIHGEVIRTVEPVWHCESELFHTASNLFIEHKTCATIARHKLSFSREVNHCLQEGLCGFTLVVEDGDVDAYMPPATCWAYSATPVKAAEAVLLQHANAQPKKLQED